MNTETGIYEGPIEGDCMSGKGQFNWYDGKKYVGEFSQGNLDGQGKMEYPGGQLVLGNWKNGENIGIDKITRA